MIFKRLLLLFVLCLAGAAQASLPIQHWTLENGARVYFVENHDLPMLDVSVSFPAGSAYDPANRAGIAMLTQHMLGLGAGGLSEDEIAKRLADVGAIQGGAFDRDQAGVSLRTLSSQRERENSLDVLARILQHPDFPAAVLEREKARVIAALKEAETQPEDIASKAFMAALYGGHPYGRPAAEIGPVGKVAADDLRQYYRDHYRAGGAVVALVGDVSRAEAEKIAKQLTEGLPQGQVAAALPVPEAPKAALEKDIAHPAKQSHILIGALGISRNDPDYYPLVVGNYVLGGGGFSSRLMEEVREKRGLVYSVYSYFDPARQNGPFEIGLQTQRAQTQEALSVTRATLQRFVEEGPAQDELAKAKQNIVLGFPLRIDSNAKILGYLSLIGFYDLPLTYLDDYVEQVKKVRVEDVKSAFKRRVHPDRMVTVVVGGKAD